MTDIVKRLRASIQVGAYHGSPYERGICGRQMTEAADEIERLRAEVAALRADAERYRFIRDNHEVRGRAMEIVYGMNGVEWDAAIDAALAKEPKNG